MNDVIAFAKAELRSAQAAWAAGFRGPYDPMRGSVDNLSISWGQVILRLGGTVN